MPPVVKTSCPRREYKLNDLLSFRASIAKQTKTKQKLKQKTVLQGEGGWTFQVGLVGRNFFFLVSLK